MGSGFPIQSVFSVVIFGGFRFSHSISFLCCDFCWGRVTHQVSFLYCGFYIYFFFVCLILSLSLDCAFLISSSVFSQVHYQRKRPIWFSLTGQEKQILYNPYQLSLTINRHNRRFIYEKYFILYELQQTIFNYYDKSDIDIAL